MEYPFEKPGRFRKITSLHQVQVQSVRLMNKEFVYIDSLYESPVDSEGHSSDIECGREEDDYKYYRFALYNYDGVYQLLENLHCED